MQDQTFRDNFTEINYYSRPTSDGYECIAEGIVKQSVNNERFFVQDVGTSIQDNYSIQAGQKIKVKLSPHRNDFLPPSKPITFPWSFADNVNDIDSTAKTQYGAKLSGYSAVIEMNDNIYKQYSFGALRTYYFTLGRLKTPLL